ncbi:MAG: ROK family protein [Chloroflexi bacterium]|nr:ROK family protein [Chloroflexota bacterium]
MSDVIIGADLGGTKIRSALFDVRGHLLARKSLPTMASRGPDVVLERIVACLREMVAAARGQAILGIGLGAPGPLNPWTGVISTPPNLPGWHDVPLRIGGGIISGGRLFLGADGAAGEVGHQTLDINGPQDRCGNVGCLEALAAGPAIARQANEAIARGEATAIATLAQAENRPISAEHVHRAARQGDRLARQILEHAGENIGVGVVNLLHLFNPRLVIIGGGVANAGELLLEPIRRTVQERAMEVFRRNVRIVPAALGDDAGLYGAVALVLSELGR